MLIDLAPRFLTPQDWEAIKYWARFGMSFSMAGWLLHETECRRTWGQEVVWLHVTAHEVLSCPHCAAGGAVGRR